MRYFLYISYKGTAYHGWQIQPNGLSVQEILTHALSTISRKKIEVTGAGRTDAGVHAKLMVVHIDMEEASEDLTDIVRRLNSILPRDIAVHKIAEVRADAHARFDALSRTYEYHVYFGKNVFKESLAMRCYQPLDFQKMNEAAAHLLHYHDFTSFSKSHSDAKTNRCHVMAAEWKEMENEWVFVIQADRFLRNMVRAIVGTLFEVGLGKISVSGFCDIIEANNRCRAGVSVPAHGLYLVDITYPDAIFI